MKYPKQVIARVAWYAYSDTGRTFDIINAKEIDGFVLAVGRLQHFSGPTYSIIAFPMEEGIGGRSVHQWVSAYALDRYTNSVAAEYDMHFKWGKMLKGAIKFAVAQIFDPRW